MACPIHDVIQQKTRQQFLAAGRRISSMDEMKFDRLSNRSCAAAKIGGARRDRTDDLLLAKQALSQLSYGPVSRSQTPQRAINAGGEWWAWDDSNVRPHPYQGCALTT